MSTDFTSQRQKIHANFQLVMHQNKIQVNSAYFISYFISQINLLYFLLIQSLYLNIRFFFINIFSLVVRTSAAEDENTDSSALMTTYKVKNQQFFQFSVYKKYYLKCRNAFDLQVFLFKRLKKQNTIFFCINSIKTSKTSKFKAYIKIQKYSNIKTCKGKYTNMQKYEYLSMQIYKYVNINLCIQNYYQYLILAFDNFCQFQNLRFLLFLEFITKYIEKLAAFFLLFLIQNLQINYAPFIIYLYFLWQNSNLVNLLHHLLFFLAIIKIHHYINIVLLLFQLFFRNFTICSLFQIYLYIQNIAFQIIKYFFIQMGVLQLKYALFCSIYENMSLLTKIFEIKRMSAFRTLYNQNFSKSTLKSNNFQIKSQIIIEHKMKNLAVNILVFIFLLSILANSSVLNLQFEGFQNIIETDALSKTNLRGISKPSSDNTSNENDNSEDTIDSSSIEKQSQADKATADEQKKSRKAEKSTTYDQFKADRKARGASSKLDKLDQKSAQFKNQDKKRKDAFDKNMEKLNKATNCETCGVTIFMDSTEEELNNLRGDWSFGVSSYDGARRLQQAFPSFQFNFDDQSIKGASPASINSTYLKTVPKAFDWRKYTYAGKSLSGVTPVKNQGNCGSCWAFANVAFFESQWIRRGNPVQIFSEQFLKNCNVSAANSYNGCNGGYTAKTASYVLQYGLPLSSNLPYNIANTVCPSANGNILFTTIPNVNAFSLYSYTSRPSNDSLIRMLLVRPLLISVQAQNLWSYYKPSATTNIYKCTKTGSTWGFNHAVLLAGYTANYWIVKNSWGTGWGVSGYIYVSRDPNFDCGIGISYTTLTNSLPPAV